MAAALTEGGGTEAAGGSAQEGGGTGAERGTQEGGAQESGGRSDQNANSVSRQNSRWGKSSRLAPLIDYFQRNRFIICPKQGHNLQIYPKMHVCKKT
jgi:hypothetical protein